MEKALYNLNGDSEKKSQTRILRISPKLSNAEISTGNLAAFSLKGGKTNFSNVKQNACHVTIMQIVSVYCARSNFPIPRLSKNIYFIGVWDFYRREKIKI